MSRSIVLNFILFSAVLYSFNQPVDKKYDFVTSDKLSSPKAAEVKSPQKRVLLGSDDGLKHRQKRTILLQNKPFRPHLSRAKRAMKRPVPKIYRPTVSQRRAPVKKSYFESDSYQKADLVIAIKSELFRLGCYRGKVNTVWGRDVVNQLSALKKGIPITSPEKVTLRYLKRQKTLGCDGNKVMDRLVRSEQKGFVETAQVQPQAQPQPQMLEGGDRPFSKKVADKVLTASVKKSKPELRKRKKRKKRSRRAARKKTFGFDGMFGIDS